MQEMLLISVGAVVGANARYWLGAWFTNQFGPDFPWGTFFINVTGGLLIGFIMSLLTQKLVADPSYRLLLVTGFLGAYTTFSSFTFESMRLIQQGRYGAAVFNIVGSVTIGLIATFGGFALARLVP